MKKLTLFITNDLSNMLIEHLSQKDYRYHEAKRKFLVTDESQFTYCVYYNLIMVTTNEQLFKWCQQIRHPVILLRQDEDVCKILQKIDYYFHNIAGKNAA